MKPFASAITQKNITQTDNSS